MKKSFVLQFLAFVVIFVNSNLFSNVEFNVSGIVECHGIGIECIELSVTNIENSRLNIPSIKSTKNGRFSFYAQPGNYEITIYANNIYIPLEKSIKIVISNKNIFMKIEVIKASKIKGTVSLENGIIPAGSIHVNSKSGTSFGKIGDNGTFNIGGIHFGLDIKVVFYLNGTLHKTEIVSIAEGESKELNLVLPYLNSIKGKVVDKTSKEPIKDCYVVLVLKSSTQQLSVSTDQLGSFQFINIPEGDHKLFFMRGKEDLLNENYIPKVQTFHVDPNQSMEFFIELEN
jgi:hypothetical protein